MELTEKQKELHVEEGGKVCPYCRSHGISGGAVTVEGRKAWQEVECDECGHIWTDEYTLSGITELDVS